MTLSTTRRLATLLASAALLASVTVGSVAAPVAAAKPRCQGRIATIVGTNKSEKIRGTNRADVIVAKGGNDNVNGRGGRDYICGGGGKDRIIGGGGHDLIDGGPGRDFLFGSNGNDRIRGRGGNDFIDGGPGIDDCFQNSGSGTIKNCAEADLSVEVIAPVSAPEGDITLTVRVTNAGPDASGYTLLLDRVDGDANCDRPPASTVEPILGSGAVRSRDIVLNCEIEGANPGITLMADIEVNADDANLDNNSDENIRTTIF